LSESEDEYGLSDEKDTADGEESKEGMCEKFIS